MKKSDCIVLLGGGLDSTALLLYLKSLDWHPLAMFFDYNQKALRGEKESCYYFTDKLNVPLEFVKVEIDKLSNSAILKDKPTAYGKFEDTFHRNRLEARNIIFFAMATTRAATLGVKNIYVGYHKEPEDAPFPDATIDCVASWNAFVDRSLSPEAQGIRIKTPFYRMERWRIAKIGYDLDHSFFDKTFSCYENEHYHECGKCAHCLLKKEIKRKVLENEK